MWLQNNPSPAFVGTISPDDTSSLEIGQLLLDGLRRYSDCFGKLPSRILRMLFVKSKDFLPTFRSELPAG